MKKILLILSLFSMTTVFSQEKIEINKNETDVLDRASTFSSGIGGFRQEVAQNFRIRKVQGKGIAKTIATFYVENDGSLSEIKATGENESLNEEIVNAISKVKQKWIPAKVNGQLVRSKFRFPMTVNL